MHCQMEYWHASYHAKLHHDKNNRLYGIKPVAVLVLKLSRKIHLAVGVVKMSGLTQKA